MGPTASAIPTTCLSMGCVRRSGTRAASGCSAAPPSSRTRDDLADRIGRDAADAARSLLPAAPSALIDPFAGSGNDVVLDAAPPLDSDRRRVRAGRPGVRSEPAKPDDRRLEHLAARRRLPNRAVLAHPRPRSAGGGLHRPALAADALDEERGPSTSVAPRRPWAMVVDVLAASFRGVPLLCAIQYLRADGPRSRSGTWPRGSIEATSACTTSILRGAITESCSGLRSPGSEALRPAAARARGDLRHVRPGAGRPALGHGARRPRRAPRRGRGEPAKGRAGTGRLAADGVGQRGARRPRRRGIPPVRDALAGGP